MHDQNPDPNRDPLTAMGLDLREGDLAEITGDLAPSRITRRIRALKELIENKEEKRGNYEKEFSLFIQGISSLVEASRTSRPFIFHALIQEAINSSRDDFFQWAKAFLYVSSASPRYIDATQQAFSYFTSGPYDDANEIKEEVPFLHYELLLSLTSEFNKENRDYILKSESPYHALFLQAKDETGLPTEASFEDAVDSAIQSQPIITTLQDEAKENSVIFDHILSIALENLLSKEQESENVANVDLAAAALLTVLVQVQRYTDNLKNGLIWAAKFQPAGKFHEALSEVVKVLIWYGLNEEEDELPEWLQSMECFLELTSDLIGGDDEDFARAVHFASRLLPCQTYILEDFKGKDFEERVEFLQKSIRFANRGANASDALVQLQLCDKTVELAFDSNTKESQLAAELTDILLKNCTRELGEVCSLQLDLLRATDYSRWNEVLKPIENALKEARDKKQLEREITIVHSCFIHVGDMLLYEDIGVDQVERLASLIENAMEIRGGAIDTQHREAFKTCAEQFDALASLGKDFGSELQSDLFRRVSNKAAHLAETLMIPDREWQDVLLCGNPQLNGAHRLLQYEKGQAVFFTPDPWKLPSSTAAYALLESLFGIEAPVIGISPHDSLDTFVERLVELGEDGWSPAKNAKYVMLYNLSEIVTDGPSLHEEIYSILGKPLGLKPDQIIIPDASNIDSIDQKIASLGGLDIVVMNIEEDGELCMHSASSMDEGKAHSIDYIVKRSTQDRGEKLKGYLVGANTILSSKRIIAVASGNDQIAPLKSSFFTEKGRMMPLSALQDHKDVLVILPVHISDRLPW